MTIGCAMPPFETTEELPAIAEPRRAPLPTPVARFEMRHSRFLAPKGNAVLPLPDFVRDRAELVALYRAMVLARRFDAKAVALQRTGRLGTFASALGQEAVPVGVASAMLGEDVADGKLAAHRILPLSLTFDHRAVTGGEAARFLKAAIEDLETPN